ncbi:MAG TPA: thiamine pyrophosphate-dependent dehydrogenase E1 component subunit alpha [bacterium]|nr:thiamine pyrophosphate-dependent dehydrogenase E1 component subunit alpha [bacterium]
MTSRKPRSSAGRPAAERPGDPTLAGDLLAMYERMAQIREFEEQVHTLFLKDLVPGTTHLCQGQEAVAVGVAAALRRDDYTTYTYRGHGHVLARGMDMVAAFAEIMGRAAGVNRGKGGSMHLTDRRLGLMGSFAIVGAGLPVAVGLARAAQLDGGGRVSVTFFGDGAVNIGAFHEALNLAAVWKAPVVFVCENNLYGEFSRVDHTTPFEDLARRATAYAMPAEPVDGNDVLVVRRSARAAVERARAGGGPSFLECKTYRHRGHSRSDPGRYRPSEEVAAWMARDPLLIAQAKLVELGVPDAQLEAVRQAQRAAVARASDAALASPPPGPDELERDVVG